MTEQLIPKHGGYRHLKSFQVAELVYDLTVRFCDKYIDRFSRTRDQMVQAARSGRQNIAEGSMASAASKKSELKLTGVAKASLEELASFAESVQGFRVQSSGRTTKAFQPIPPC
jgi:four helix bundle protein